MNIAFVNQPYDRVLPPNPTSIGLIAYMSALELAHSQDVSLFCKMKPNQAVPGDLAFTVKGISASMDERMQAWTQRFPRWAKRLHLTHLADTHPQYVSAVEKALDESRPTIVHIMNYWSWCRRLEKRKDGRRIVLEMQCEWLSQKDSNEVRKHIEAVDAIVAVSDHVAALVRNALADCDRPIITAYNGVDTSLFKPNASAPEDKRKARGPRLLFVGRVSPEKGVHTLLEAFVEIAKHSPDATLDLIGGKFSLPRDFLVGISEDPLVAALDRFYDESKGSYQQYLEDFVRRAGLTQRVRFLGAVPHAQLISAYQNADVLINPSLSESFGITVVEAMASGVPVVVTRVGGMKETVVNGETGFAVEPDEPEKLARAITSILGDTTLADQMGRAGRARATEMFSWKARAARLLQAYARAAA
jgi:glycosyltransferase involved in cell wall biosynthesis